MAHDDSTHVAGLAEVAERLEAQGADVEAIAAGLAEHEAEAGLPVTAARGASALRLLAERLAGRRLTEDLGTQPASVDWFTLHVPRPGSAAIDWDQSGNDEVKVGVTFVAGIGAARTVSWTSQYSFPPQSACLHFIQHVDVHIRLYATRAGAVDRQIDIVKATGREVTVVEECPLCRVSWRELDPFDFEALEPIDYRKFPSGAVETHKYSMETSRTVQLDVPLPGLDGGRFGLSAKSETSAGCTVRYELPGGRVYRPYRLIDDAGAPPFWPRP